MLNKLEIERTFIPIPPTCNHNTVFITSLYSCYQSMPDLQKTNLHQQINILQNGSSYKMDPPAIPCSRIIRQPGDHALLIRQASDHTPLPPLPDMLGHLRRAHHHHEPPLHAALALSFVQGCRLLKLNYFRTT